MDAEQQHKYLAALFEPGDGLIIAKGHPSNIIYSGPYSPALTAVSADYICINPIKGQKIDKNATAYKSFLLEFDGVSIAHQLALIDHLKQVIPVRTVVSSGNKSIHAVISLIDDLGFAVGTDQGIEAYKAMHKALRLASEAYLKPFVTEIITSTSLIDPSNCNASRFTRLGGGTNNFYKKPDTSAVTQSLVDVGNLISCAQLIEFVSKYKPYTPASTVFIGISKSSTFAKTLESNKSLGTLHRKLNHPKSWAAENGNHPEIFKLACWAIEATGVTYQEFSSYIQQTIVPHLLTLNYSADRVDAAVKGAYNYMATGGNNE
jgi:hypothetical protein